MLPNNWENHCQLKVLFQILGVGWMGPTTYWNQLFRGTKTKSMWRFPGRYQTFGDCPDGWQVTASWSFKGAEVSQDPYHKMACTVYEDWRWLQNISSGSYFSCSWSIYAYIVQHIYIQLYTYAPYVVQIYFDSDHTPSTRFQRSRSPLVATKTPAGVREDLLLTALEEGSGTQRELEMNGGWKSHPPSSERPAARLSQICVDP